MRIAIACGLLAACGGGGSVAPPSFDGGFGGPSIVWSLTIPGTATSIVERGDSTFALVGAGDTDLVVATVSPGGDMLAVKDLGVEAPLGTPNHSVALRGQSGLDIAAFDRFVQVTPDLEVAGEPLIAPNGESWHGAVADGGGTTLCGTFDTGEPFPLLVRVTTSGAIDPSHRYVGTETEATVFDCVGGSTGGTAFTGRAGMQAIYGHVDSAFQPDTRLAPDGVSTLNLPDADGRSIAVSPIDGGYIVSGALRGDLGAIVIAEAGGIEATIASPIAADHAIAFAVGFLGGTTVMAGTTSAVADPKLTESAVVFTDTFGGGFRILHFPAGTRLFALTPSLDDGTVVVAGDIADDSGARAFFAAKVAD